MPLLIIVINFAHGGVKQNIAAGLLQFSYISFNGAGVIFQVFWVVKLGGVYKNAANSNIVAGLLLPAQLTKCGHGAMRPIVGTNPTVAGLCADKYCRISLSGGKYFQAKTVAKIW
jgi:hypothetical protein